MGLNERSEEEIEYVGLGFEMETWSQSSQVVKVEKSRFQGEG